MARPTNNEGRVLPREYFNPYNNFLGVKIKFVALALDTSMPLKGPKRQNFNENLKKPNGLEGRNFSSTF